MPKKPNHNKFFTLVAISLIIMAALPSSTFAQAPSPARYNLRFEILEEENRLPLANANVSLYGPVNQSKLSEPDGTVVFSGIPAGYYSIIAVAPNYIVQSSQDVTLTSDTTIILLFSTTRAIFDYTPAIITTKTTVYFDASKSNSSGIITDYKWDFGDNTTTTITDRTTTNHTFAKTGEYRVSLTVTSTVGVATYERTITVNKESNLDYTPFILLLPIPLIIFLYYRRRKYYVVIQTRIPLNKKHPHCPGDDTDCENCNLTPC